MKHKKRHIKTFLQKFGNGFNFDFDTVIKTWKGDEEELFNSLPSIGVFYIPFNYTWGDWWYEKEMEDVTTPFNRLIKAKVAKVDDDFVEFFVFDDHHWSITKRKLKTTRVVLVGNIITRLPTNSIHGEKYLSM